MKIPSIPSKPGPHGPDPLSSGLKIWLIASVVVLLGALLMFVSTVVAGFLYFNDAQTPLWVTVVGIVSVIGIAAGFGGLFLTLALAALQARKADKALAAKQGLPG